VAVKLTLVESPFAGRSPACSGGEECRKTDLAYNVKYVRALCLYLARRGDAPYASHVFCTEFLDDTVPEQRSMGIEIGLAWGSRAALTVVGVDRGISAGMRYGIERARAEKRPVEWLSLSTWSDSWLPDGISRVDWTTLVLPGDQSVVEWERA
jgi:hypothetical protein